jgi:hypothetical protein
MLQKTQKERKCAVDQQRVLDFPRFLPFFSPYLLQVEITPEKK